MSEEVSVFYLARAAEGVEAFASFANSYNRFAPGKPHRLVVIYKGFDTEPETPLKAMRQDHVFVSDDLTDIGSYIEAAKHCASEYLCFLNTFSVILAPDWLRNLYDAVSKPSVAIAGATASWESILGTFEYIGKAVWLTENMNGPVHRAMMHQLAPYLRMHAPKWTERYVAAPLRTKLLSLVRAPYSASVEAGFPAYWNAVTAPDGPIAPYREFPAFPNPHIRSNGFIIRRADFLREFPSLEPGKHASHLFESGPRSLTARLLATGKSAVVVARGGRSYLPDEWADSSTFRLKNQPNLLIADNQTVNYTRLPRAERQTLVYLTWAIRPASLQFLTLGMDLESKRPRRRGIGRPAG
jgi:hypothetical protein